MKIEKSVNITQTDYLSKTTKDYLNNNGISNLFPTKPTIELILKKSLSKKFSENQRQTLVNAIIKQYKNDNIKLSENSKVYKNINSLLNKNVFTCTTGQQIHIFLGPLFFIYKIKSLLKIINIINSRNHENKVVPIFWMATEDHDFEEINKTKLYGKEYIWQKQHGNAVGRLKCEGLTQIIDELEKRADKSEENRIWFDLLRKNYHEKNSLSVATRGVLHHIFEKEGLIILNPDDAELKKIALNIFEKEISENLIYKTAKQQNSLLKKEGYKPALNPQKLNYFWFKEEKRLKIIENKHNQLELSDSSAFSVSEIKKTPENLSPNVLSRAMYQEAILPNIVYVGGNAEIEYWMLLTQTFEALEMQFPVLMLRDSAILLSKKTYKEIDNLNLLPEDLLLEITEIIEKSKLKTNYQANKIEKNIEEITTKTELLANEMINHGYEKAKVELYEKELKSIIAKLEHYKKSYDYNAIFENKSYEKIIKLKSKYFSNKQERIDYFSEYPKMLKFVNELNFNDFDSKLHFLSY